VVRRPGRLPAGRLKSFPDAGGGSLLDNTIFYWPNELSTGTHKHNRTPVLMATGNFTLPSGKPLETGRYLKYPTGTSTAACSRCWPTSWGCRSPTSAPPSGRRGPCPT
jgi:hypothetical protein